MKAGEFVKHVIVPLFLAISLAALFRPLCMGNGRYSYLKLWWLMGVPFGIHRMSLWIIPKGYDIGRAVGILFINVLIGGVVGGIALAWKLIAAAVYLMKAAVSAGISLIKKPQEVLIGFRN